jgi:hypothetical protein
VGVSPTSPQLLFGRVPHVTDETSEQDFDHDEFDNLDDDLDDDLDFDEALDAEFGSGFVQLDDDPLDDDPLDDDTVDAIEAAQREMAEARARLAVVPAEVVVINHVMGLYELGAIHLSATPPDLVQAALAIDAVACLVDGLGDRLGDEAPTMRDALNNIRLAFVQIKGASSESVD